MSSRKFQLWRNECLLWSSWRTSWKIWKETLLHFVDNLWLLENLQNLSKENQLIHPLPLPWGRLSEEKALQREQNRQALATPIQVFCFRRWTKRTEVSTLMQNKETEFRLMLPTLFQEETLKLNVNCKACILKSTLWIFAFRNWKVWLRILGKKTLDTTPLSLKLKIVKEKCKIKCERTRKHSKKLWKECSSTSWAWEMMAIVKEQNHQICKWKIRKEDKWNRADRERKVVQVAVFRVVEMNSR